MKPGERILHACQQLILEYGYRNFSMDQLAKQAGVSKRTLYRYFPSKDAVIEACVDFFMQSMVVSVDNILQQERDPSKLVNLAFANLMAQGSFTLNQRSMNELRHYYPHLWTKIDQFRQERIRYVFSSLSSVNNHSLFNDVDPRIALSVILASIQAVLNPDFILDNGFTFQEAAQQLSKILLAAFLSPSNVPPQ